MIEFQFVFEKKLTPKVNVWILIKMNSARSNVKLNGQINSEFDEFATHGNLMKRGIQ